MYIGILYNNANRCAPAVRSLTIQFCKPPKGTF